MKIYTKLFRQDIIHIRGISKPGKKTMPSKIYGCSRILVKPHAPEGQYHRSLLKVSKNPVGGGFHNLAAKGLKILTPLKFLSRT